MFNIRKMSPRVTGVARWLPAALSVWMGPTWAADLQWSPPKLASAAPTSWEFRITPYGWLPSMKGTQTVRGRSSSVDASFIDILDKSDTLVGLMADFEARYGRWSLLGDVVWNKVGLGASATRTRASAPAILGSVGASLGLQFQMAIVELAAAYEVGRTGDLALDLIAGGRYWHQKADLSLDVAGTFDFRGLEIAGARAVARSGAVAWLDPLIGARLRYQLAPGHNLSLRTDIGGFDVGSRFSWQVIGAYGFDFAVRKNVAYSGVLGYRALYVDYTRGAGASRYGFDMLQHGPVVGISARF
ncbi:MAG: hypothetical protein K2X62_11525 [Beijerinckiaceae bacterium]|nr:hypothetical protein [Beijerinckiaceae bacterium]MBX9758009.1 hypothetical protein [Beijerinckiaceae bacterium]MDO9442100.1 hypothetical protein [Beijerinckiaceae bacterium]